MLKYFRRPKASPAKIELISVHIPKTAGTSFRHSLQTEYGKKAVARLDIHLEDETIKLNEKVYPQSQFPESVKVLHGHFSPYLLQKHFSLEQNTPIITWLRDPVDRVASNYYYLAKRLKEELQEEHKQLNILSKMQRSLLEYAQADINRNRMSSFLRGMPLSNFDFVGILEHFSEDLTSLADFLSWTTPVAFQHNITGDYQLTDEEHKLIRSWNQLDVQLYEKALQLRKKRLRKNNNY